MAWKWHKDLEVGMNRDPARKAFQKTGDLMWPKNGEERHC